MDYDGDRTPALDGIRTDYHGEQCFTERQRRLDLILADHVYCHLCGAGAVMAYLFIKVIKKGPYAAEEEDHHASDPFNKEGYNAVS